MPRDGYELRIARKATLLVLVVLLLGPALSGAQPVPELEQESRELFDRGRYAEAADRLRRILDAEPGNRTANVLLSFALARAGQARAAVEETRRALDRFPANVKLQLLLAGLLSQQNATQGEALERYQAVLRRDPDNVLARVGVAETLRSQGRVLDAINHYARLTELAPDDPRYLVRLGQAHGSLGELSQTRRYFERAYELAPSNVDTVRGLAILGDVEDRPQDALRYYRELSALYPGDASAQIAVRAAQERAAEPQFPLPLDEMERTRLEAYQDAAVANSKQLQHRKEQLAAARARSWARFLPSFFFAPSHSEIHRFPKPSTSDSTTGYSFSFGWNVGDLIADPYKINISGMQADFESVRSNILADVNGTYYQRLQNIVQYRQLQRTLALEPQNAQLRQNKQTLKYAILSLTERLRILTGMP